MDAIIKGTMPNILNAINQTEYFINRANELHDFKYTYPRAIYKTMSQNIIITCEEHGDFEQQPHCHLVFKSGCKKCASRDTGQRARVTLEDFIKRSNIIHNFKYGYGQPMERIVEPTEDCDDEGDIESKIDTL